MSKITFYYTDKKSSRYRIFDSKTKQYSWSDKLTFKHEFSIFQGYEATDDGLFKYANDFNFWVSELKNNDIFKIDYTKFYTHDNATERMFVILSKGKYEHFDDMNIVEFQWQQKCNRGAIVKLICKENATSESYGYDFKNTYPFLLGDSDFRGLEMPTKQGTDCIIDEITYTTLEMGYYHCLIKSSDMCFNSIFNYSTHNVYTNIDLLLAFVCQKRGMVINIEMIKDNKPNAYIYGKNKKDGIIKPSIVFGTWYKILSKLREEFKDNLLVKYLMKSCWGHLCGYNKKFMTIEDINEKGVNIANSKGGMDLTDVDYLILDYHVKEDSRYYELADCNKPFKYGQIARIKPFLLARARYNTASVALLHIEDVIRIHTDCIVYNKQHDGVLTKFTTFPRLVKEKKTNGLIKWTNCNNYEHL